MDRLFDGIIAWAIRQRLIVLLVAVVVVVLGVESSRRARIDVLPEFTPPYVVVQTEATGMATTDVEELVTLPLERVLLGSPSVTTLRSTSALGVSVITVLFQDGVDIYRARQIVTERLELVRARLPTTVKPPQLVPIVAPISALLKLCLTSSKPATEEVMRDLRTFAEWRVRPRLLAIPGVTQVIALGGGVERVEVRPDPVRMRQRGVSPGQVRAALIGSQAFLGVGFLESGPERLQVQAEARLTIDRVISTLESLRLPAGTGAPAPAVTTTPATTTGTAPATASTAPTPIPLRVVDVASVVRADEPHLSGAIYDARPAVYVQINKLPAADAVQLTHDVEAALHELEHDAPEGGRFEPPVFRQATIIEHSITSVGHAMALGSILVIIVLIAFLRSPRLAAISLAAIPLSILAAAAVLARAGETVNAMTLGGLALAVGEVVDDAIVDVENVWRRLRQNAAATVPRPALEVIRDASHEIRGSVVYATVIVCLVLVPVLLLGGVTGNIFAPLARAYILAIAASLAVALTVTPAMCAWLLPRAATAGSHETWLAARLTALYARVLKRAMRHPRIILIVAAVLGAAALTVLPQLGGRFLPELNEGALITKLDATPGTSIDESMRLGARVDAALRPAVASHLAIRAGRAEQDEDAAPTHRIEVDVLFKDGERRDPEAIAADIRAHLEKLPGVEFGVEGFFADRLHEIMAGSSAPVVVKVIGPEIDQLRAIAAGVSTMMQKVPGLEGVHMEPQIDVPQLRVRPDLVALARYGVLPASLAEDVAGWLQGSRITQIAGAQGRLIDVVVAGPLDLRNRGALADLPISTATGEPLPLSALARIDAVPAPVALHHEGGERRISVQADAHGSSLSRGVETLQRQLAQLRLPKGYRITVGGEAEERSQAVTQIFLVGAVVAVGVFVLLRLAFSSSLDAIIVLLNIPLGLVGGALAAVYSPGGLSVSSLVGFVTLFGIICRNGIMLVAHKQQLDRLHPDDEPLERVVRAAKERLLPIIMTAATAELGLLPLALSAGAAGSELEVPMARIVCAGLVSSTLMNMVVVPCVYAALIRRRERRGLARA